MTHYFLNQCLLSNANKGLIHSSFRILEIQIWTTDWSAHVLLEHLLP